MKTAALTPQQRRRAIEAMAASAAGDELDILVIGGGVTGAGIALDAVTRGLKVGIVEAQDWAAGTSSRSTKLVHGGLRYLEMFDFKLVREALTERDLLTNTIAPHLVRPVSFLYPLKTPVWDRFYVNSGVTLYDAMSKTAGRKRAMPFHQNLTRKGIDRLFPELRADVAVGAIRYWDAMVDDARLVETIVRTAVTYGAHAASRAQVVDMTRTASGAVTGAHVVDLETGTRFEVKARAIIAATGVWTEETEGLSGAEGGLRVLASKGIHVVVPREKIRGDVGVILQTEKSVLFMIPWPHYWVIGTTDTPWDLDPQHPVATSEDVDYVLDHANTVLEHPLTRDDVIGVWAGLRPLLQPGTKAGTSSAKVSREHTVASPAPGLVSIAGGKLTTYRVMASDAVDFALGARAKELPSVTADLPLAGAEGLAAYRRSAKFAAARWGWDTARVEHLLARYGSLLDELVELCDQDPSLAEPLEHAPIYLRVEAAYAATHEGALHLEDVLVHRTRLTYEVADKGLAAAQEVAELIAPVLGWDASTIAAEVASYTARCEAETAAARTTDDAAAVHARAVAPDVVAMVRPDTPAHA